MSVRRIVQAGILAALYFLLTWVLAPISYGPIQLRVAELLKPAALFSPVFALAFGVGTAISNLPSPFGFWDYAVMPIVDACAAYLCWRLRRWPLLAVTVQAAVSSVGVAVFPLRLGGGIPIWPTVAFVLVSVLATALAGYFIIWRKYGPQLLVGEI